MPFRRYLAVIATVLFFCRIGIGEDSTPGEYQVKAVFLFNFTKFVDWPQSAFDSAKAPFVIGILGDNPFGKDLETVIRGETAHGHPLVVKPVQRDKDLTTCHVLFISRAECSETEAILKEVSKHPILTVADAEGSAARGIMINFLLVAGSVKMEINPKAAEQGKLHISSKLLGLAKVVETDPKLIRP